MRRPPDPPPAATPRLAQPRSARGFAAAACILGLSLAGCTASSGQYPSGAPLAFPEAGPESQLALLGEIDSLLSEQYLYDDSLGPPWEAERRDLESRIRAGMDDGSFRQGVKDLLAALPVGTAAYLTRQERVSLAGGGEAYGGIGAFIAFRATPEPRLLLLAIVEGSPAQAAGLLAHEAIYAIDGRPVRASDGMAAAERIRGPQGSSVRLDVGSPDGTRRTVEIDRQPVVPVDSPRGRVMTTGAVHFEVPVLADSELVQQLGIALEALEQEPESTGLVIDLRIAGSDGAWPLEEVLGLFLEGGSGTFVGRGGEAPLHVVATDVRGSQTVPLVVLIGADTHGAPEIFAAEILASQRGVVVGTATPGGVFASATRILSDGSQLTFASSSYRTNRGLDLGTSGVIPNIPVEADWDEVTDTIDPVLATALALLAE